MNPRTSIFLRLLGALILIGLLVGGGALLYRAGQTQGYLMGQAAAGAQAPSNSPALPPASGYPPYYYYGPHWGFGFGFFPFGFFGLFFGALLFFFALRLLIGPRRWYYHGPWRGDWQNHPYGPPPWTRGQPNPETGEAEQKNADA
jgi:hypothetical protein